MAVALAIYPEHLFEAASKDAVLKRVAALTASDNASVAVAGAACAGSILRRAGEGRACMDDAAVEVAVKGLSAAFQVRPWRWKGKEHMVGRG